MRRPRLAHDLAGTLLFLAILLAFVAALVYLTWGRLTSGAPVAVSGYALGRLAWLVLRRSTRRIPTWVQAGSFAVVAFAVPLTADAPWVVVILALGFILGLIAPNLIKILISTWFGGHDHDSSLAGKTC